MTGYKYLLFDADDTLLDFASAEKTAFEGMCAECGIDFTDELYGRYHAINASLWKTLETGGITLDELKIRRYHDLVGNGEAAAKMAHSYEILLGCQSAVISGAPEICRTLGGKYGIYIITNGIASAQRNRIKNSLLEGLYDGLFISGEIGYAKPDRRFFDAVCEKVGDPDRSHYLVIGDTLSSDIAGANNAGIDSVWLNPHGKETESVRPTYTVNKLDELYEILGSKE